MNAIIQKFHRVLPIPLTSIEWRTVGNLLQTSGVIVFSFFAGYGSPISYFGIFFCLIALLANSNDRKALTDPLFVCIIILSAYILCSAWWSAHAFPETAVAQWDSARKWIFLFFFFFIAFSIKTRTTRLLALAAAMIGLLASISINLEYDRLLNLLQGARSGFGTTPLGISMRIGIAIIGLLCYPFFQTKTNRTLSYAKGALWILLLVVFTEALIIAKSRGIWISLAIIIPLMGIAWHSINRRNGISFLNSRMAITIVSVVIGLSLVLAFSQGEMIASRLNQEFPDTIPFLFSGQWDAIPYDSIGARVHLVRLGIAEFLERPLFGWGPGSSSTQFLLFYEESLLSSIKGGHQLSAYSHLHNTYLEILVRFGLAGFLGFATILVLVYRRVWLTLKDSAAELPAIIFAAGAGLLMLSYWWFDFRILSSEGRFVFIFVVGLAGSLTKHPRAEHGRHLPDN